MSIRPILMAALLASGVAHAAEAYKNYDTFTGTGPIDATRWTALERTREIRNGELVVVQREVGGTSSSTGVNGVSFGTLLSSPERVKQMRAKIRIDSYELSACAGNATPGAVVARMQATFFNTGIRQAGALTGDMLAQTGLRRRTSATGPSNELEIFANLLICSDPDCLAVQLVGSLVLGTTTLGTTHTMLMEWDPVAKLVRYSSNNGTSFQSIPYTQFDGDHPGRLFRAVGTRVEAQNCTASPRPSGRLQAAFDNVFVNLSAKP